MFTYTNIPNFLLLNAIIQVNMSVRNLGATGMTTLATLTLVITIKILRPGLISSHASHIAPMIRIVDLLSGRGTIVAGGSMENAKINLTLQ